MKKNTEKAKQIVDRIFESGFNTNRTFYDMALNSAMEMAEWKDNQFQEEKKKWLDKACMWIEYKYIKNSGGNYSMHRKENIIKSFKQAMEEE